MTIKNEEREKMFCFDVLDVLFCGPEISPVAWKPFVLGVNTGTILQ